MIKKILTRFWFGEQGLAAIEFAFVLPIILAMFLGLVELSDASGVRAQVINMASTSGDLISQSSATSGSDMDSAFAASKAILFPHDTRLAAVSITSVIATGKGKPFTVAWSCTMKGSAAIAPTNMTKGTTVTLPTGILADDSGGSVIWSRVTYQYTSFLSYFLPGTKSWSNDFYVKPRRVLQIPYSSTTLPTITSGTCNS